jgi:hypothetical protein
VSRDIVYILVGRSAGWFVLVAPVGAVRRVEDANAWRVVGRSPYRHEWFGYPDGGIPDVPFDELVDRIACLTAWDPDTVYHLRGVPDERINIDIATEPGCWLVQPSVIATAARPASNARRFIGRLHISEAGRTACLEPSGPPKA